MALGHFNSRKNEHTNQMLSMWLYFEFYPIKRRWQWYSIIHNKDTNNSCWYSHLCLKTTATKTTPVSSNKWPIVAVIPILAPCSSSHLISLSPPASHHQRNGISHKKYCQPPASYPQQTRSNNGSSHNRRTIVSAVSYKVDQLTDLKYSFCTPQNLAFKYSTFIDFLYL